MWTGNISVFIRWTGNIAVSIMWTGNISVFIMWTGNIAVSIMWTGNIAVSIMWTGNISVSIMWTGNISVSININRKGIELISLPNLKFSNPYILSTWWCKPMLFPFKIIWSNRIHSLKYLRLSCKNVGIINYRLKTQNRD